MILLAILGVIFIMTIGLKNIYVKNWNKGITAQIDISQKEVYPGTEIILTETITNRKWLPLPIIKVKFEVDRSFLFAESVENTNATDNNYKSDAFSILCYQRIIRKIPVTCMKRGYYWLESMDVVSSDIWMDSVLGAVYPIQKSITVYPEPIADEEIDIVYRGIMGDVLTRQYIYDDPFEFRGIREYQNYDSMKLINWKASAKTGEWKVNMHDYTARQEVCILLNLESEGIWEYEKLKETSISLASALACRLSSQGIGVSILSNGIDKMTQQAVEIESGSDEGHRQNMLLSLSRIDLTKKMQDFGTLLSEKIEKWNTSMMPILISTSKKQGVQTAFAELAKKTQGAYWICPLHADMALDMSEWMKQEKIKVLRWEVQR